MSVAERVLKSPAVSTSGIAEQTDWRGERSRPGVSCFSGRSSKIGPQHLQRLAIVYVRQSSPQQVLEHRESRERQYALVDHAQRLGWPRERVIVIDDDQGQSATRADNRLGFQRLLSEVALEHVGLVLSLEMSRLARSCKDWHHLLEVCGIFGCLLADQDGLYDPADINDRLMLGLKGTMSEVELHTMRSRLLRGSLNKAQRGELYHSVPFGYVILANGQVSKDPDAEARSVVETMFAKFAQIGTMYGLLRWLIDHDIRLPIRLRSGPRKGELDWRRASLHGLSQLLHHPIYAGAYAYGRYDRASKRGCAAPGGRVNRRKPMDEWTVLIQDRVPAYISWEQYEANQAQLRKNRQWSESPGVSRRGAALLGGLVVCGKCGCKMGVSYGKSPFAYYSCTRHQRLARKPVCPGMKSTPLDSLISEMVLEALAPASVELSLRTQGDLERERRRLDKHWQQQRQRARYELELAERRYRAVDPENRLVAATLEQQWEAALLAQRKVEESYDRFQQQTPPGLTDGERARIRALCDDIPRLWDAQTTRAEDRKDVLRCLIDRVVVDVSATSSQVNVTVHWAGGHWTQCSCVRPVKTYAQMENGGALLTRVKELHAAGNTPRAIAEQLEREGFRPPKTSAPFSGQNVTLLLKRRGLAAATRHEANRLSDHEWWLADLAARLKITRDKLRDWVRRGWVNGRRIAGGGYWIVWADSDELSRLQAMCEISQRGINQYPVNLRTPKAIEEEPKSSQSQEKPSPCRTK